MPRWAFGSVRSEYNGGGGGSRTRVRKYSPHVSTCLVPGLSFAPGAHPEPGYPGASLKKSRQRNDRYVALTSPRSRRSGPVQWARTGGTAKQTKLLMRSYNRLRLYFNSIGFTSRQKLGMQR